MKNNMEKRIIEGKKRDEEIKESMPKVIRDMFRGLQYKKNHTEIAKKTKYPTLDEQDGNFEDDEKPDEDVKEEDFEDELKEL